VIRGQKVILSVVMVIVSLSIRLDLLYAQMKAYIMKKQLWFLQPQPLESFVWKKIGSVTLRQSLVGGCLMSQNVAMVSVIQVYSRIKLVLDYVNIYVWVFVGLTGIVRVISTA
jgi:hypothetical protein